MFREMRRVEQKLTKEECKVILENSTSGVLSLTGDNGYPYGVPLSYVYCDNKLFFHSAPVGYKIDLINKNDKVSFCIIALDTPIEEKRTTLYKSIIALGRIKIVDKEEDIKKICTLLSNKYAPSKIDVCEEATESVILSHSIVCLEMDIEELSGKCSLELKEKNGVIR